MKTRVEGSTLVVRFEPGDEAQIQLSDDLQVVTISAEVSPAEAGDLVFSAGCAKAKEREELEF